MKFPYFPFYVNDFAADAKVEGMALIEVGAYILLLCKAWNEDPPGTLPNSDRLLARWSRLSDELWLEHREFILAPFKIESDGRWHQKRMESEYKKLKEKYEKLSLGAQKTNARRDAQRVARRDAQRPDSDGGSVTHSESESDITHTEPILPTVQEVIEYGAMGAAIPKDYCEHYHDRCSVLHRWLSRGELIDWRRDITGRQWWGKDRTTWGKVKTPYENHRANNDRNAGTTNEKQAGAYEGIGKRKT